MARGERDQGENVEERGRRHPGGVVKSNDIKYLTERLSISSKTTRECATSFSSIIFIPFVSIYYKSRINIFDGWFICLVTIIYGPIKLLIAYADAKVNQSYMPFVDAILNICRITLRNVQLFELN